MPSIASSKVITLRNPSTARTEIRQDWLNTLSHILQHCNYLKYHLLSTGIPLSFNPLPTAKKAFPNPPVIAYRRNTRLRDLLVHSTLSHENSSGQQPAGIKKCNQPCSLTCSFLREGQTNYTFCTTNEARKITNSIYCNSKNLIYLIECRPSVNSVNALGNADVLS